MKNSIFVLNNVNIILVNTMKKTLFLLPFFCLLCAVSTLCAADTLFIKETRIPILIERQDNVLFYLRLDAKDSKVLDKVVLKFDEETVLSDIQSVKLYYGGLIAKVNNERNKADKSALKTTLKKFEAAVTEGNREQRDADGEEGDARGYKVKAAVQGLGKDTEAVGGEPGSELDERQEQRPEQRREGRVLFFGMRFVVRGFGSHENTPGKWPPLCGRSRKER